MTYDVAREVWFVEPQNNGEFLVFDQGGMACIATVHTGVLPEGCEADHAQLIRAAPALLRACEATLSWLAGKGTEDDVLQLARAAQRLARGSSYGPR
jgi:hypothetical protein